MVAGLNTVFTCDAHFTYIAPWFAFSLAQIMYATSPYSDPVVSADIDPQPIIDEEEGLIWVVGPVLAVVFIICIVIAILLYKR